jgi:hypothetical protein
MGYLNNSTITVDAVLTKKGRELLARGRNEFRITQFALSDDEIDYDLWNPAHPLGSNYYGSIIENMPLVEATTDESNIMRYKLLSLPKGTTKIPSINAGVSSIVLRQLNQSTTITPSTANIQGGNQQLGYTAILSNSDVATLQVASPAPAGVSGISLAAIGDADSATTVSAVGLSFKVIAKQQITDVSATITIIGNETGGSVTIPLTVKANLEPIDNAGLLPG